MATELDETTNFEALATWEQARSRLDGVFQRIFDVLKTNPALHALVDSRESDPLHKAGDLVTDYRDGTVRFKLSDGKNLIDVTISALGGEISDSQHGLRGAVLAGSPMHSLATTTDPGFMSAADKVAIGTITAPPSPSNATPATADASAGAAGSSALYARGDHAHQVSVANVTTIGTANSAGSSNNLARADHVHAHGNQTSGSLHALATTSVAGFMDPADKTKINDYAGFFSQATLPTTSQVPLGTFGIWWDTSGTVSYVVVNGNGAVKKIGPGS